MIPFLTLLLHAALIAAAAPLLDGFLRQAAARLHRAAAPPPLQSLHDLRRLWRKPPHRPAAASFLTALAPPVALAAAATAALLTPSFSLGMATAPAADLVVIAALLALSRLLPALAAIDAAAPLAAAQIPAARLPAEPVLLLAALALILLAGTTNLDAAALATTLRVPAALAGLALLAALFPEPPTPAAFTGRDLALVAAAAQLRRVTTLSVAAAVIIPLGLAPPGATPDAWLAAAALWAIKLPALGLLATALAPYRVIYPAAALLALIAAVIIGIGARA